MEYRGVDHDVLVFRLGDSPFCLFNHPRMDDTFETFQRLQIREYHRAKRASVDLSALVEDTCPKNIFDPVFQDLESLVA